MERLYQGWPLDERPVNILSSGLGQDSTAMLLLIDRDPRLADYRLDLQVVFSDTRSELPETYETLRLTESFCASRRIPFTHLRPVMRTKDGAEHAGLEAYCLYQRVIPARRSDRRWCTDRIKVTPITNWVKSTFPDRRVNMMIGFGAEEGNRQARTYCGMSDANIKPCFPLIEAGLCRHRCVDYIAACGFPVPIKSGCFYCPFGKKPYWKWLRRAHPDLFERAARLEENGRGFDRGFRLAHKPLRLLVDTPDRKMPAKPCICGKPRSENWSCASADAAA